jgi:hypothetical protein
MTAQRNYIGSTGATHLSQAEASVSFKVLPMGIVPDDSFFPVTFTDSEGTSFPARMDYRHEASGYCFEYKPGSMNGIRTKASADRQREDFDAAHRQGFVQPQHYLYRLNEAAWSNSIMKQAIVQKTLGAGMFALLLAEEPDPTTREGRRVLRSGVFYRTERNISGFAFFLQLASMGLDVGFTAQAKPGGPWHVFCNAAADPVWC